LRGIKSRPPCPHCNSLNTTLDPCIRY
jgi:hypothetical protein